MPGRLRDDANCPVCGRNLVAIVDTSNSDGVKREYFHDTRGDCKRFFKDHDEAQRDEAQRERTMLETVPAGTTKQ